MHNFLDSSNDGFWFQSLVLDQISKTSIMTLVYKNLKKAFKGSKTLLILEKCYQICVIKYNQNSF